jgi:hypothetical protein
VASPTPTPSATNSASPPDPISKSPEAKVVELATFERILEAPVHSLALGKKGRIAALGDDAWLDEGKGVKKLPRPPKFAKTVQIYFGRDDQPRLMGFVPGTAGDEPVYLRWRSGAWERGASEIGRLGGGANQALFGVLGYDDPEVVCRVGDQCIIKRLTGWKTITAPAGLPHVELCGRTVWAIQKDRLDRLEDAGFRAFGGEAPFKQADSVWAPSDKEVWVTERAGDTLHHYQNDRWSRMASPIKEPRAIWATSASDVWLVGQSGAAHWDGQGWQRARGAPESVSVVTGRSTNEIWLAGASGIWRATRL